MTPLVALIAMLLRLPSTDHPVARIAAAAIPDTVTGSSATPDLEVEAAMVAARALAGEDRFIVMRPRLCRVDLRDPECANASADRTVLGPDLSVRMWSGVLMTVGTRSLGKRPLLYIQRPLYRADTLELHLRKSYESSQKGVRLDSTFVSYLVAVSEKSVQLVRTTFVATESGPVLKR